MDALAYAVAMAAANAAAATPPGGSDIAHYTGQILSWDELTGLNSVLVNGATVSNLRVIRGGIGLAYQPGDTVLIEKRMSQWYILGNVGAPGAGAANQIGSAEVTTSETTGSTTYTDLATPGPSLTVNIGSSRRCLLMVGARISCAGTASNAYIGGSATANVTGASNIPIVGTVSLGVLAQTSPVAGGVGTFTRNFVLTAANGLNQGANTFTMQYRSNFASPVCGFSERNITVIPF
ncbi:hypothetical protein [Amycolatopsis sp. SID8362]|uniref:hypothetical protein n=1 Tax=Amycolatopsis sp. SID8362 TaxID=2690346 RepID=UPI001367C73B|nr:hypothetical protein [Amycolatopsis sp. SID8362]NBH01931.1 hypothetical protein [Amycolatopsis sp. SID8362]NED38634.1 hypothetical protein [Amycolatopsis sp. SID8362]